ncbi:MAG: hypothetical protein R2852_08650 [Bacteroidia bacterium]
MLFYNYNKFWNYKRIAVLFLGIFLVNPPANAQLKDPGLSISVEPSYGNRILIFKTDVSQAYKDSLNKADHGRLALGANLMVSFSTRKDYRVYTGIQFHNFGFTRKKENLKFLDTIHPQIGRVNDLSQTGGAYVDFHYRYYYLSVPLLFSKKISGKSLKNTSIHWMYGGSASVLIKHDIFAKFHGFSTRGGKKEYILDNSSGQPERINVNLQTGLRIENALYGDETFVYLQPEILLPVLNANGSKERHRLWTLGIQVGIYYQPDQKKDR